MLPPLPRCSSWAYSSLISPSRVSLPRKGHRVGLHIDIFEACSAFTRVAACTLALSPIRDTLIEGFSHFVASMTAPIASGWSESPGGTCTHWKAPPCHGAPPSVSLPSPISGWSCLGAVVLPVACFCPSGRFCVDRSDRDEPTGLRVPLPLALEVDAWPMVGTKEVWRRRPR